MTEIAHYETTPEGRLVAVPAPTFETVTTDPTGGRLVAWADGLAAAHRIGSALCQTAFVPAAFRNKPDECAAAILFGDEIGLTPTQSLRSVYTVSGTPGLYARAMVALVLAAGHEVWTVSKSDASVTVAGRRRGSSHVIEETWTTARASKAGYTNNKKYASDPRAMLYARAAADVCRQVAPDALAGLAYTVEELELAETPTTTTKRTDRTTTARRAPVVPEPDVEPPVIEDAVVVEEPADGADGGEAAAPSRDPHAGNRDHGEGISDAQMRKLGVLLKGQTREQALAIVSSIVGRDVESRNDLTKREASTLIDALEAGEQS